MPHSSSEPDPVRWVDLLAVGASAACLAHCLLLPLLFALLPALSQLVEVPSRFHVWAFIFAIPASAYAMRSGYRAHGLVHPLLLGGLGLVLLGIGALAGLRLLAETGVTVVGSFMLALAHLRNWRLQRGLVRTGANA